MYMLTLTGGCRGAAPGVCARSSTGSLYAGPGPGLCGTTGSTDTSSPVSPVTPCSYK